MIVSVGNSGAIGVEVGLLVGVPLAWADNVGVGVATFEVGVDVAIDVAVEVGVGVAFDVLTSTTPSVMLAVIGWTTPFFDGRLRIVPSMEIGEVPLFRTLKLIVTKTPFPVAVELDNKASATV